jgi:hypothetical protein
MGVFVLSQEGGSQREGVGALGFSGFFGSFLPKSRES